jgi:hypothetical protein
MDPEAVRRERDQIERAVADWTVCSMFQEPVIKHPDGPALMTRRGGVWQATTWHDTARAEAHRCQDR